MGKPLPIRDRVRALSRLAGLADRHHDLWWFFENPQLHGADLRDHVDFAKLERHSHRALCILHLTAFLSGDEKSTHVSEVLDEMDRLRLEPEFVEAARKRIAELAPVLKRLVIIRGNAVAHRSRRISHDDAYQKAAVKIDDLKQIVGAVRIMATALADLFSVEPPDTTASFALEEVRRLFTPPPRRERRRPTGLQNVLGRQ